MNDSNRHLTDDASNGDDTSQTEKPDTRHSPPSTDKDSDKAQREQERQMETGEENPT